MLLIIRILSTAILLWFAYWETGLATVGLLLLICVGFELHADIINKIVKVINK